MPIDVSLARTQDRYVDEFRQRLLHLHSRIEQQRDAGASGSAIARFQSETIERLIGDIIEAAVSELSPLDQTTLRNGTAVLAIAGLGRGELAPYSDIDLLFLYQRQAEPLFHEISAVIVRNMWDSGLKLGHSVRTVTDALQMAKAEPTFATALVEMRRLWGDGEVFDQLRRRFKRQVTRERQSAFVADCIHARKLDFGPHGTTVTQLEPDIKRSPGGLRDLHLIRWLGFASFGTPDWNQFPPNGIISRADVETMADAHDFLTKLRIELHLAAGKSQDVFTREEQLRISQEWGIEATSGLRPVERLMQKYFRHSTAVSGMARRFTDALRKPSLWQRLVDRLCTHRVNGQLRISPNEINLVPRHKSRVLGSIEEILRLYHTIGLYGIPPSRQLELDIKHKMPALNARMSAEAARLVLAIFGLRSSLGMVLRSMYETGLLEVCLPEMAHARCLLQFNQYHHYTVDEHTLRAVEAVTSLLQDQGPLGIAYRQIDDSAILHLAVFLHDLGKGYPDDHSEVGRQLAEDVAERLGLSAARREILVFLVHQHLLMTHLAFRRDIHDEEVLLGFSHDVGSPQVLRMLYVLSAADLQAVGPGVWNGWKGELLNDLFESSLELLSGEEHPERVAHRLADVKQRVLAAALSAATIPAETTAVPPLELAAIEEDALSRIRKRLETFSPQYLLTTPVERIVADMDVLRKLTDGDVDVESRFDPETQVVEYRVITHERVAPGCFHKIAGALTANYLEILSAHITTTTDGFIIDRFRVLDHDYAGTIPADRLNSISSMLQQMLNKPDALTEMFQRRQRFGHQLFLPLLSDQPVRVVIDNGSSHRCTIIDVFAHDRLGLLYTLSRSIYELGLSVVLAKIATHLDQVVDVFYITDMQNRKITDEARLNAIRETLEQNLSEFDRQGYRQFLRAPTRST
ncbi:MAG: [protein-PII] uridylyltransferase [Planctomycetaceae bacterium]